MIIIFGGTTEGRKAAEVLEEGTYYYSTKTGEQTVALHHGIRIDGALDAEAMSAFCQAHGIRLMVDASHPFASQLHQTIAQTSRVLNIPVVRYERIFPPRDPDITWIDDYYQIPHTIHTLLATTGVQSIARLKPLEAEGISIYYRILNRESSKALARSQGVSEQQLVYYDNPHDIPVAADAMLLKESGITGGFPEKVAAAKARGMQVIAIRRPPSPVDSLPTTLVVNGPHGLRRAVEKLLPEYFPLHSGLTTGTCATAAAVAATRRLLFHSQPSEVPVILPNGETITVAVGYGDGYAYCVKEAGDDPDVTNGIEIRAMVELLADTAPASTTERLDDTPAATTDQRIIIDGGEGVGRFTLPGFDYAPGEAAINKSPRQMIRKNVLAAANSSLFTLHSSLSAEGMAAANSSLFTLHSSLKVTISVPGGAAIARRTFNPRLGIEGGISIIGVSGIVVPFSEEAFVETIRKCMTVAKASGSQRVVINSGAKSERYVKALYPHLPQQAFVHYGNYIGETLTMATEQGFKAVTLGVMLGKAVKLAEGHLDTHSRRATMNRTFVEQLIDEAGCHLDMSTITLARELWERLPNDSRQAFATNVIRHCLKHCQPLLPNAELTILLIDDNGNVYS